jgi:two-component sensor histidine kinase
MLTPVEIERRRMMLAVIWDITAYKRSEAEVQLLIREIDHRSKNMLSLVQARGGREGDRI